MRASALAIVVVILASVLCAPAPATARQPNAIDIAYVTPTNPQHIPIYERLKERRVLERLQQLLSPFRLPRRLTMKVEGCDGDSNAWYAGEAVTVCYEYLDDIWQNAFKRTTFEEVAPIDVMVGPLIDVFLHELGHALFDLLDVPLFGREEDAADQVSAYIMLHLGKDEARRIVLGTAYAYRIEVQESTRPAAMTDFADEHGTPAQRFYSLLCIAYGAEPRLFRDMVDKGYLPKNRADGCDEEYAQVQKAFRRLIEPHIEPHLAQAVHERSWLPERSTRLPTRPAPRAAKQKPAPAD
jgi:hypothetical protein